MKELQITVSGQVNTGKTTLMNLLEKFLVKEGFNVEINLEGNPDYRDVNHYHSQVMKYEVQRKEAIKNNKIILTEKQVAKDSY